MSNLQSLLFLLKSNNIKVSVKGESIVVDAPPGVINHEIAHEIKKNKEELIQLLSQKKIISKIPVAPKNVTIEISTSQKRIWDLSLLNPSSSQYNIPTIFKILGPLDCDRLIESVATVSSDNRLLASYIENPNDKTPIIKPLESFCASYSYIDLNQITNKNDISTEALALKECHSLIQKSFELGKKSPLWRWAIIRLNNNCHYIIFVMHHIIFDGLSKEIFLKELADSYNFIQRTNAPKLQFIDYLLWEKGRIDTQRLNAGLDYWKNNLSQLKKSLELPHDLPQTKFNNAADNIQFTLNNRVFKSISSAAIKFNVNHYHILLAGFFLVINRHTNQENLMICTPSANRNRSEIENVIGYFNNVLPIFINLPKNQTIRNLVTNIKDVVIKAYDFQSISLSDIANISNLKHVSFRRAMLSYQNSFSNILNLDNLESQIISIRKNYADFDLSLYFEEVDNKIICNLDFNSDLFSKKFIHKFILQLAELYLLIDKSPDIEISKICFLGHSVDDINEILTSHPQIDESLVMHSQDLSCNIAYAVLNEHNPPELSLIREYLNEKLPAYAVPKIIIPIDQFPLLNDGSIDFESLPAPSMNRDRLLTEYVAPISDIEKSLCDIWKKVLWVNFDIGVNDQFIALGGHSLLSVQLIHEIEKNLNIKVPSKALSNLSTIKQLTLDISTPSADLAIHYKHASLLDTEVYMGLKSHTSSWLGHKYHPDAIMVGMNSTGTKTPIFWCLQRYQELQQLSKYLGNNQPVYGMRSGNRVMIKNQENIERLAYFYVQEILDSKAKPPYIIGGNCQAALIAFQVAQMLQSTGREVSLLILQEKFVPFSYTGRVALLFGENSTYHPKFSYVEPHIGWRKYYSGYLSMSTIKGGHGEFFKEPNITSLTSTISKQIELTESNSFNQNIPYIDDPLQVLKKTHYEYEISHPDIVNTSPNLTLKLPIKFINRSPVTWLPHHESGIAIYARWFSDVSKFIKHDSYTPLLKRIDPHGIYESFLEITTPSVPGKFILQFDLIDEGVSWFRDNSPVIRINVNP